MILCYKEISRHFVCYFRHRIQRIKLDRALKSKNELPSLFPLFSLISSVSGVQRVNCLFFVTFLSSAKFANYPTKSLITLNKSNIKIRSHFIGQLGINLNYNAARLMFSFPVYLIKPRTCINTFIMTTKKSKHKIRFHVICRFKDDPANKIA